MGLLNFLNDKRFNLFFSFMLGIGLICILRPQCQDGECNISKAPIEKDFEKYAYRMGGGKCFEFKAEIVECPASGTIEAFRECQMKITNESFNNQFARRESPIKRCD